MNAVWQLSAGPGSRSYADIFCRYGVALIGPGDAGAWAPTRDDDVFEGGYVRRFASEIAPGDIFVLRTGRSRILGIGLVVGEYLYLNAFDDVNGWDLQHARRVRWARLPSAHDFGIAAFGANPPRCSRVWNDDVLDYVGRFLTSPPTYWQSAPMPEVPSEEPPLAEVPRELAPLVAAATDLLPLMQSIERFGELPSEDELIVHFVVPLLRVFGWPPERIGVKWRRVDVAVFRTLPRVAGACHLVIEAKRLGAGVEGALEQAQGYAAALGTSCDLIVTDGIRYRLYDGKQGFAHRAYANLARLKKPAAACFARIQRPKENVDGAMVQGCDTAQGSPRRALI